MLCNHLQLLCKCMRYKYGDARVTDCETESQVAVDLESPVIKVKNDLQVWCIVCAGPWVEVNVPLAENRFRASMEGGQ